MLKPFHSESKEMIRDVHTKNALLIKPFTVIIGRKQLSALYHRIMCPSPANQVTEPVRHVLLHVPQVDLGSA